jgi:hypothetical protein
MQSISSLSQRERGHAVMAMQVPLAALWQQASHQGML